MFGSERGCNTSITKLDLVVSEKSSLSLVFSHSLLSHLSYQLHLSGNTDSHIVSYFRYPSVELYLLFFLFFFFLYHLADICCSHNCHSDISVSETSDIVGSISCIYNTTLIIFEIFNNDLFIVRRCS